jgi:hypothetical protein
MRTRGGILIGVLIAGLSIFCVAHYSWRIDGAHGAQPPCCTLDSPGAIQPPVALEGSQEASRLDAAVTDASKAIVCGVLKCIDSYERELEVRVRVVSHDSGDHDSGDDECTVGSVTVRGSGRFAIPGVPVGLLVAIEVTEWSCVVARPNTRMQTKAGGVDFGTINVPGGVEVTGVLRLPSGRPAADFDIRLVGPEETDRAARERESLSLAPVLFKRSGADIQATAYLRPSDLPEGGWAINVKTMSDGAFRLRATVGIYRLSVNDQSRGLNLATSVAIHGNGPRHDLGSVWLTQRAMQMVAVVDARGKPLRKATVVVSPELPWAVTPGEIATATGMDGKIALPEWLGGTHGYVMAVKSALGSWHVSRRLVGVNRGIATVDGLSGIVIRGMEQLGEGLSFGLMPLATIGADISSHGGRRVELRCKGDEGEWRCEGVPVGRYRWLAQGTKGALSGDVTIGATQEIVVHEGSACEGAVIVTDMHRMPVDGAVVAIVGHKADEPPDIYEIIGVSDGQGRVPCGDVGTRTRLTAFKAGVGYGEAAMEMGGVQISLQPLGRICGVVAGGAVSQDGRRDGGRVFVFPRRAGNAVALATASVDEAGGFAVEGLVPGYYDCRLVDAATMDCYGAYTLGLAPMRWAAEEPCEVRAGEEVRLVLDGGLHDGTIVGVQVTNRGLPFGGVRVEIQAAGRKWLGITDDKGRVRLGMIPSGRGVAQVFVPGLSRDVMGRPGGPLASQAITVAEGEWRTLEFALECEYVDGRLLTPDGSGRSGVYVFARHVGAHGGTQGCVTSDGGSFRLLLLRDCAYSLHAEGMDTEALVVRPQDVLATEGVVLRGASGCIVEGVVCQEVLDECRGLSHDINVSLQRIGSAASLPCKASVDSHGRFLIVGVAVGEYKVMIECAAPGERKVWLWGNTLIARIGMDTVIMEAGLLLRQ